MAILTCFLALNNVAETLEETLEALIAQDYKDFELILCNNGSTDDTQKLLEAYQKKDKRITLINEKKKQDKYLVYNSFLDKVKTKYFTIHGPRDVSIQERFEMQMKRIKKTSLVGLGCGIYEDNSHINLSSDQMVYPPRPRDIFKWQMYHPTHIGNFTYATIYSKAIAEKKIRFEADFKINAPLFFDAEVQCYFPLRLSNLVEVLYIKKAYKQDQEESLLDSDKLSAMIFLRCSGTYKTFVLHTNLFYAYEAL